MSVLDTAQINKVFFAHCCTTGCSASVTHTYLIRLENLISMKTGCDYLNSWSKKTVTRSKISTKMVNPRDLAGERRRRRRIEILLPTSCLSGDCDLSNDSCHSAHYNGHITKLNATCHVHRVKIILGTLHTSTSPMSVVQMVFQIASVPECFTTYVKGIWSQVCVSYSMSFETRRHAKLHPTDFTCVLLAPKMMVAVCKKS